MAYENLCMYCFEDNGGNDICPHCGRDARAAVPQIQLMPGTLIYKNRFLVGRALGQDAGGIVYSALDTRRNVKIRIREYLPRESARRLNSGEVVPEAGHEDRFEAGLRKLRASVEGVEDPTKRHFFFEENGTGYIAQRKSAGGAGAADVDETPGERSRGSRMMLVVVVAAALVLAVAVGVIALVSFFTNGSDDRTVAPITTGEDLWTPPVTASPTPYASATFNAIKDPENDWMDFTNPDLRGDDDDFATPTPVPTPDNEFDVTKTINGKSSPEVIKKLQKLLIDLGWLEKGGKTGKYDDATRQAVKDFQQYMNDTYAIDPKLTVDGVAGPKTLAWLVRTDLSRKPDPTPEPVTPNPTGANEIIDEKASPERIKYVQMQLVNLGILGEGYPSGTYDKATRNGVAKFQRRVNDLQGYDALREDGTCDASTLAYLDYYVEWWQENKPTKKPEAQITPEPAGDYIDENSNSESIKRVQEMLIDLGYLAGSADGKYGEATYEAVKEFQTFVNIQYGNKVAVTGKCDQITLQYLEYCHANMGIEPTDEPEAQVTAPSIEVTGALSYANGVYAVGEDGVKISWKSDDASAYSIYLTDHEDNVVSKEIATSYTSLSLSKDNLSVQNAYIFTVTAIPHGGDEARGASSYVKLIAAADAGEITPEPTSGPVSEPVITVSGALGYTDGVYQIGPSGATITWSADGAASYSAYFTDNLNSVVYEQRGAAGTSYTVDPTAMTEGEKYTFTVVAIAPGSAEADGEYASVRLVATGSQSVEPETTPASDVQTPVITVDGELGFRDDVHWAGEDMLTISWSAQGRVRAYSMYLVNGDGTTLTSLTETDKTSMTVDPASMNMDQPYVITVIAIPEGGGEEDGASASIMIQRYNGQTPEPTPAQVGAPEINVSGYHSVDEGVYFARKDAITVAWTAEGAVESYDLLIMGSDGSEVLSKTGVKKTTRVIAPEDMAEGVVYTMTVTAIPEGGSAETGAAASVQFALYVPPVVGEPVIEVAGYAGFDGEVYFMGAEGVNATWSAENAAAYSVYLYAPDGKVVNSAVNVQDAALALSPEGMKFGDVYTLTVIAVYEGGSEKDGVSASVKLGLAEEIPAVEVPVISAEGHAEYTDGVYFMNEDGMTLSWVSAGAKTYDITITDSAGNVLDTREGREKAYMNLKAENFTPGEICTFTVTAIPESGKAKEGQSASVQVALMDNSPVLNAPVISAEGYAEYAEGVYIMGEGELAISWECENAAHYSVYISDPENKVVDSRTERKKAYLNLDPSILEAGKTYTFTVIAVPEGGAEKDGASASILVALGENAAPALQAPVVSVENHEDFDGSVYYVGKKNLKVTWSAEGAAAYNVALVDEKGKEINAADGVTVTQMNVEPENMKAGVIYTLTVAAVDEKGRVPENAVTAILLAASEAAETEPEATEEPENGPGYPEITVDGHVAYENETYIVGSEKAVVSYSAKKAAAFDVVLTSGSGELIRENRATDKTSINIKPDMLAEGEVYTLSVTPFTKKGVVGETAYIMLALESAYEEIPVEITPESDPETIKGLQRALYALGWLTDEMGFEKGIMDAATMQAVYEFQTYVIEQGLNPEMALIDPENPVVDLVTITMLADEEFPVLKPGFTPVE